MPKSNICILGSTGSIGQSALMVIREALKNNTIVVLTANTNVKLLFEQCQEFHPVFAIMASELAAEELKQRLQTIKSSIIVLSGRDSIINASTYANVNVVIAAIVGSQGLEPIMTAVYLGLKVLLANKEALVMSGDLLMQAAKQSGSILLPIDSEHNAIFQSLPSANEQGVCSLSGVNKVLLTASGGPFLNDAIDELPNKTPEEACHHPNWSMGKKISVDSATMMNKGLEFIEAAYLFHLSVDQIEIIIHPQSIIHSMVSYIDGSVIAQMGHPDMKTPIAYCLAWPKRMPTSVLPLDFFSIPRLDFIPPDFKRYPCLLLAQKALSIGKSAPCIVNAANEVAVAAFLKGKIQFTSISKIIALTLKNSTFIKMDSIETVLKVDKAAQQQAKTIMASFLLKAPTILASSSKPLQQRLL
jgi:1-deoxy-D-xylulose-5-phosphate reductoisomerase